MKAIISIDCSIDKPLKITKADESLTQPPSYHQSNPFISCCFFKFFSDVNTNGTDKQTV